MTSRSFVAFVALVIATSCCALKFEPFGFMVKKQKPNKILEITKILEATNGGLITSRNEEIVASIEDLRLNPFVDKRDGVLVDGLWESLWTTEKETLFFKKNGLFGKDCTRISQFIDLGSSTINNLIEFEDERKFSVKGTIDIDATKPERVNFSFSGALLSVPPLNIPLPPVGKGWFETIYVDKEYRVSYDVRGDYLISRRI